MDDDDDRESEEEESEGYEDKETVCTEAGCSGSAEAESCNYCDAPLCPVHYEGQGGFCSLCLTR